MKTDIVSLAPVPFAEFQKRSVTRAEVIEFARRLGWPRAHYSGIGARCELVGEVEWRRVGAATAGARRELFNQLLAMEAEQTTKRGKS
jgi:hypothetical protein